MHIENELVDMEVAGKERVGQTESGIDIDALPCVKYMAGGKLLHSTGGSAQCPVTTEKSGTAAGGREVQE